MATHSRPGNEVFVKECPGQFQWARVRALYDRNSEIRRECPVCGCRQQWSKDHKIWASINPNPDPGSHDKYLRCLLDWGP